MTTIPSAWRAVASCASTNDLAAAWAREGAPAGAVVIADEQTSGRGRLGRAWHSPPGESLYMSVVLRPALPPRRLPPLTLAVAVALAETIAALGAKPFLKWPNDVLLHEGAFAKGRKLAGILTEASVMGSRVEHAIVGIGVNLNTSQFPDELEKKATSLLHALGRTIDRDAFARSLCARLAVWHDKLVDEGASGILAAWRAWPSTIGQRVTTTIGERDVNGVAESLDDEGHLWLRSDEGERLRVTAGDVVLLHS